MTQRIEFVDLAKGICISLVVLLHVFGDLSGGVIQIMNLFRMPLYFVLSGLFFKSYNGFVPFFKKKTNKLLIPFFFTFIFVVLPTTILLNILDGKPVAVYHLFILEGGKLNLGIDGAIWFLLCLFIVNIYFYMIFLLTNKNIVGIIIFSVICGFLGYAMSFYGFHLPMWMDSAFTAMPFFLYGYILCRYSEVLYGAPTKKDVLLALVSFLILLSVFLYDEWCGERVIAFGENTFNISFFSLYFGGIFGTYCILMIAKFIGHLPILSYIGRYSIVVLITHLLYLFVIRNILYQFGVPQNEVWLNTLVFISIIILSVPTISFCIKYLPYWFAQKDIWQ